MRRPALAAGIHLDCVPAEWRGMLTVLRNARSGMMLYGAELCCANAVPKRQGTLKERFSVSHNAANLPVSLV